MAILSTAALSRPPLERSADNEKAADWFRNNVMEFARGIPEVVGGEVLVAEVKYERAIAMWRRCATSASGLCRCDCGGPWWRSKRGRVLSLRRRMARNRRP